MRHDEVLRLEDEDDAGHEAEGGDHSEDAARVFQEKVTENHHLEETTEEHFTSDRNSPNVAVTEVTDVIQQF